MAEPDFMEIAKTSFERYLMTHDRRVEEHCLKTAAICAQLALVERLDAMLKLMKTVLKERRV